jgi:Gas vesicle synthesis protein GvpL/GvpF
VIYLYAFVRGLDALPDDSLATVPLDGIDAVVGAVVPDEVLVHGLVVESLQEHVDALLPARFGEQFESEAALVAAAEPALPRLRSALDRVSGCVELSVRAAVPPAVAVRPDDGTAYMRARIAPYLLRNDLEAHLYERLRTRARAARLEPPARDGVVLEAVYLVPRDELDAFVAAVDDAASARPQVAIACTGPWAPYSFVEAAQ